MKKIFIHLVVVGYFLAYCCATYQQNDVWGNILAPFGGLLAAAVLYYVFRQATRKRLVWLSLSIACWIYGNTDLLWAVDELLLGLDPNGMAIFDWLYLFPNFFLVLGTALFVTEINKTANKMQLALDVACISLGSAISFWIIFMHGSLDIFIHNGSNIVLDMTVLTDFIVMVGLLIWGLSIRKGRITGSIYITIAGAATFAFTDLLYVYQEFYELYVPNTIIDAGYTLAFFILAAGGILSIRQNNELWAEVFYSEANNIIGDNKRGWLLLIFPCILLAGHDPNYWDYIWVLSVFIFYWISTSFIQNTVKSKLLCQHEQVIATARQLELTVNQDALTKLPNRRLFLERLEMAGNNYRSIGMGFAVVFLDIDGFKMINDTYGHDIGDQLLIEISQRFSASIRKKDTIARLGGDEFVLIFTDLTDEIELQRIMHRLRKIFADPLMIDKCICEVGVSLGVSKCPEDSLEAEELIKIADERMYREKVSRKQRSRKAQ